MDDAQASAFFAAHYPGVVRHLTYLLGDRGAAEDMAQEAFLRWWRRPPRDAADPGPWLRVVSSRLALNYLRGERRRRTREERLVRDRALATDRVAGPEALSDADAVRAALDRLRPRDRLVLLLRTAGEGYAEIGAAIGVRPGSVGTILARATRRFREVYTEAPERERQPPARGEAAGARGGEPLLSARSGGDKE